MPEKRIQSLGDIDRPAWLPVANLLSTFCRPGSIGTTFFDESDLSRLRTNQALDRLLGLELRHVDGIRRNGILIGALSKQGLETVKDLLMRSSTDPFVVEFLRKYEAKVMPGLKSRLTQELQLLPHAHMLAVANQTVKTPTILTEENISRETTLREAVEAALDRLCRLEEGMQAATVLAVHFGIFSGVGMGDLRRTATVCKLGNVVRVDEFYRHGLAYLKSQTDQGKIVF